MREETMRMAKDDWRKKMNKRQMIKVCVVWLLFLSFLTCRQPEREEGTTEEKSGAAPVKVFKVQRQKISERLFYTGVIEAWNKINVTPDIGGKIAKIHVE